MVKAFMALLAILSAPLMTATAEPQAADLTLTMAADKADYVLGEDVQAEVTLTNASDKNLDLNELTFEDFKLENYDPHPAIQFKVAV